MKQGTWLWMFGLFNIWKVNQNDSKYLNAVGVAMCACIHARAIKHTVQATVLYNDFGKLVFELLSHLPEANKLDGFFTRSNIHRGKH